MKVEGREESSNVEDERGKGISGGVIGGGIVGVIVLLIASLLGVDPKMLQSIGFSAGGKDQQQTSAGGGDGEKDPVAEKRKHFVGVVLKDTETVWDKQFRAQLGRSYAPPRLKLYTGAVQSACGFAQAAVGPFYCPGDERVYLDLSFFDELDKKLGAKGDFGMAYAIAHEVGHHIQSLIAAPGTNTPYIVLVNNAQVRKNPDANKLQVRLELQADYLAGVWAHFADQDLGALDAGDVEEGIVAARAVADDTLQKKFQGYVVPEKFTHGSAKQRAGWFMKGYKTGDIKGMHELFERPYESLDNP